MDPVIRRCGRTRCDLPRTARPCQVSPYFLPAVPSTLLIPLAARAAGPQQFPWLDCHDAHAANLLHCLDVNPERYVADAPTVINILWRTREIKTIGAAFFQRWPSALGVNLGCGLSSHFQWFENGRNGWVDADLPEVFALREALLPPPTPRWCNTTVDLREPDWWSALALPPRDADTPVLVLCEGVLMYLEPPQVHQVLRSFAEHAPAGSLFVLDTLSALAVGRASLHASVGRTGAEFHWGLRGPQELTGVHPRLRLQTLSSVTECYGWAAQATEACWQPWLGVPLYGLATLGLAH